jgi:sec-independent protein translocase protein TatB
MFDIGFIELVICAVIALLILGPERLPGAARTAGRWVGGARRMVTQFTSELDRELRADELRKELRKAGDIGLDDVDKTVKGALNEAKQYEDMILSDSGTRKPRPAPATRRVAGENEEQPDQPQEEPQSPAEHRHPDSPDRQGDDDAGEQTSHQPFRDWEPPEKPGYDPHAMIRKGSHPDPADEPADSEDPETPKDKPERHS